MRREEFKKYKKAGRGVFHFNYLLFMFLCLVMAIFGTEGNASLTLMNVPSAIVSRTGENTSKSVLTSDDVYQAIVNGEFGEGLRKSNEILENIQETIGGHESLGRTRGILAGFVNAVSAGRLNLKIAQAIRSITKSDTAARIIFIILNVLWTALIWIFIRNVMSAAFRRLFLEARLYDKIPLNDALHFAAVRRWIKASWTMFVRAFFLVLWALTVVGLFIKYYAYYAVPYIVAENPDIGPMEAIRLSEKMMYGHKKEAFLYDLSFIGWYLLEAVTVGISDLVYGFPYRMACRSEYYVHIRELAIETGVEGYEKLNDKYLFEKADKLDLYETYFDVVDRQAYIHENDIQISKFKQFTTKWLGIWPGSGEGKEQYEEIQSIKYGIYYDTKRRDGRTYPNRLNPLYRERKQKERSFSFLRSYTIWSLMLLFILFAFVGWAWEVSYVMIGGGGFVNRGVLHGPWLPIYGFGAVIALVLCARFRKHPVKEFFISIILCGILEYFGGWMLETIYHERWWSYDGYFLNLHGRICAEGLFVFGVGCMIIMYVVAPIFDYLLSKLKRWMVIVLAIGLMGVFIADVVYSSSNPNMAEGAIEGAPAESGPESGPVPDSGE